MLKPFIYTPAILLTLFLASCKLPIKPDQLYGKWKYIKVERPDANPPDSVSASDLKYQAPYIEFKQSGDYAIIWGGKVLSHGTFTTNEQNIKCREILENGTIREFPFWVTELTDKKIVFQNTGTDRSKVTAVKE
jgi:hypothetical protein